MILEINQENISFWGDTHGNWVYLKNVIKTFQINNTSFIQVGDFGIGFRDNEVELLNDFNSVLRKTNCYLYIIRGNHDNPNEFTGDITKYSNIVLLKDYTVIKWYDKKILCVGGALSIDREKLKLDMQNGSRTVWWENEQFVYDEAILEDIIANHNINIVVTHTAPTHFHPISGRLSQIVQRFAKNDKTLVNDLHAERLLLNKLYNKVVDAGYVTHWYYGHFHYFDAKYIDGVNIKLLNIDEISQINIHHI